LKNLEEKMAKSKISWTNEVWNFITGCDPVSRGCDNCYAKRMAERLYGMGHAKYQNKFKVTIHKDVIQRPLQWKKGRKVFVNSMSDIYHDDVPKDVLKEAFEVMGKCPQHMFQVLTKRPDRMIDVHQDIKIPSNTWMGVSVENNAVKDRIKKLCLLPEQTKKFISFEPILKDIIIDDSIEEYLKMVHWIIVGGESGAGAREMKRDWARTLRDFSKKNNIPFFYKQFWGSKKNDIILDGEKYQEFPEI
jgi:protein gp37